MSHVKKIPGTDHPITLEPTAGRVVVRLSDRIIADTDRALTMREASYPPVYYIPLTNVDLSALLPSSTTTYCPYKGEASYHGLTTTNGHSIDHSADLVWMYRTRCGLTRSLTQPSPRSPDTSRSIQTRCTSSSSPDGPTVR